MNKLAGPRTIASFIEPMLALSASSLPEGSAWEYELKLDGYRALAIKSGRHVQLRSRNDKDLGGRFPGVVAGLEALPSETVIDGEVVALDDSGRPSFNTLQNYAVGHPIFYYAFDLLILKGRDLRSKPLSERRELLRTKVLSKRLRGPDPQRLYAVAPAATVPPLSRLGDQDLSIRQSSRSAWRALGTRPDGGQDARVPVAQAGSRRSVRVRGMDTR